MQVGTAIKLLVRAACAWLCVLPVAAEPLMPVERPSISVTFINPGKTGEVFWELINDTMHAAGRNLDVKVETLWAERNFRRMQEMGLEVVSRPTKPNFLIVVNEEGAALPILLAAEAAGVRTLMLGNALMGETAERYGAPRQKLKQWIGSLVPDVEEAGARMAQTLIEAARGKFLQSDDGKIHLLALGGDESTPLSHARNRGLMRVVAGSPDVVVDRMLYANWNEAEAEKLSDNFLQWAQRRRIAVAGVWAANDPMALGAMKSARRIGYVPGKDMLAVGLNWSPVALEKVASGELLMSDGGHFLGGALAIMLLRDYADGCDFAQNTATQVFRTSAVTQARAAAMLAFVAGRRFEQLDYRRLRPQTKSACGHYDFTVDSILQALVGSSG